MKMDAPVQISESEVSQNLSVRDVELRWKSLFDQIDRDDDGKIPAHQLSKELSENYTDLPKYVIKRVSVFAERNRDGFITYAEFLRLVEKPHAPPLLQASLKKYVQLFVPRKERVVETVSGRYEQEYTCDPPALGIPLLSVAQVLIYMFDVMVTREKDTIDGPFAKWLAVDPRRRIEIWRIPGHALIHANEGHLASNVIIQILVGIPLEMIHQWWRILIIFVSGVISGSLLQSITSPWVASVGASGGDFALLSAQMTTILLNWNEMDYPLMQMTGFSLLVVSQLAGQFYDELALNMDTGIGIGSHLGGAIAGICVGSFVLRNIKVREWELIFQRICVIGFSILMLFCILFNIFVPSYFLPQDI